MKNIETFLEGLTKLSRETGIIVGGCGCCNSPFLQGEMTVTDLKRGVYRHNFTGGVSELEFFIMKMEEARAWCVARGFEFRLLTDSGCLYYRDMENVDQHTNFADAMLAARRPPPAARRPPPGMPDMILIRSDARAIPLADESVQCCVQRELPLG